MILLLFNTRLINANGVIIKRYNSTTPTLEPTPQQSQQDSNNAKYLF